MKYSEGTKIEFIAHTDVELIFCPDVSSRSVGEQSQLELGQKGDLIDERRIVLTLPPEGPIVERLLSSHPLICHSVIAKKDGFQQRLEPFELRYNEGNSSLFPNVAGYVSPALKLALKNDELLSDTKYFNYPAIILLIANIFALLFEPGIVYLSNVSRVYLS